MSGIAVYPRQHGVLVNQTIVLLKVMTECPAEAVNIPHILTTARTAIGGGTAGS